MTVLVRERARLFYDGLLSAKRMFEAVKDSQEMSGYTHFPETLESLMERIRSKKSVERAVDRGLLDEIENPDLLRQRPWDSGFCKRSVDTLYEFSRKNVDLYVKCLTKVGSRRTGLNRVHGALLTFSYHSLYVWDTLAHLNAVNREAEKPFGFDLAVYATPERLMKNFDLASSAIVGR